MFQSAQLGCYTHQAGITSFNSYFLADNDIFSATPFKDFSHLIMSGWSWSET